MKTRRRTWQHECESRSRDQLQDLLHSSGWVIETFSEDYGEDLYIRIFERGNPTGHDFYIQLKGTDNIKQYVLKKAPFFSYSVDLANLKQWHDFTWPVIFVLWDIEQRLGYWAHMQPLVENHLQVDSHWLENLSQVKEPTRTIRIPIDNILKTSSDIEVLRVLIGNEYDKTKIGRQYFERLHQERVKDFKSDSESGVESSDQSLQLPPNVRQQFLIAQHTAAVTKDPSDIAAWLELAHIHYELDEKDKALVAINRAWELEKDDLQIVNARACILAEYAIATGGPKSMLYEAISLFESLRSKMNIAIIEYNIGNSYAGLSEHHKAIEHFDKALSVNPNLELAAQIWKNRGTAFYHLGNRHEEIRSFQQAITLNPNLWQAYASWAASEIREGDFAQARNLLTKAFQANPNLDSTGYNQIYWLAYTLFILGILNDAYERINQLLSLKPEHENGQLLKAHILSQLWRDNPFYIPKAIAFFKDRIVNNPEDMFSRGELYLIYNSEGYKDEAQFVLEDTINLGSTPPQTLYHYALLLEREQKFTDAIHYLELAYQQNQEHHIVHSLARLNKKIGEYHEAIKYYEMALESVSEPSSILSAMADCYYFLKDYRKCVHILSRIILLGYYEIEFLNNLKLALQELGVETHKISIFIYFITHNMYRKNEISEEEIDAQLDKLSVLVPDGKNGRN